MTDTSADKFAGSIPRIYESHLVPLIFEPYAIDLAARVVAAQPARVLEIAAGTGVVTRHLASTLPADATIVATDLNPPMLTIAAERGTARPVQWQQADAMQLPFDDGAFDAVVCQFGAMFFPDRAKAFAEMKRVLRPGGTLLFNVWDRLDDNEFPHVVVQALATVFPQDPPDFVARVPHGYHDRAVIETDVRGGGFDAPTIDTVTARSRAASARIPAIAFCQGTPMRSEIEARDASRLDEATDVAERALVQRFGSGAVDGRIQAHVVTVRS